MLNAVPKQFTLNIIVCLLLSLLPLLSLFGRERLSSRARTHAGPLLCLPNKNLNLQHKSTTCFPPQNIAFLHQNSGVIALKKNLCCLRKKKDESKKNWGKSTKKKAEKQIEEDRPTDRERERQRERARFADARM